MKNVCLILPGYLPVPAVKGGAVETLVELLIEENEKQQEAHFTIVSAYNLQAIEKYQDIKFKYTNIIWVQPANEISNKGFKFLARVLKKVTNIQMPTRFYDIKVWWKVRKMQFDVIIYEGGDPRNGALLSHWFGKEKMVMHLHGETSANITLEKIYNKIFSVSNYISQLWKEKATITKNSVITIKNGVRLENFQKPIAKEILLTLKMELNIKKDEFVIMFCGRITEEKGVKILLEAIENVKNNPIKLIIIGSSFFGDACTTEYQAEVLTLAAQLKDKIIFTGYIPNYYLPKYYQVADVVVVPSICNDAAPLVPIEAMASGKPIITTEMGGISEYVRDECGYILSVDNLLPTNIAYAIKSLYEDQALYIKKSLGALKQAENFSAEKFYHNFVSAL